MNKKIRAIGCKNQYEDMKAPEVLSVHYDLWQLKITIKFDELAHPVYIIFNSPVSFCIRNESDLVKYWLMDKKPKSWFWIIQTGGWKDQEREMFSYTLGADKDSIEYFVAGIEDCVTVVCSHPPQIFSPA